MSTVADKIREYYESPVNLPDLTEKQALFLEGLRLHGTVLKACEYADITRQLAYIWRSAYPQFRLDWDSAKEDANDKVKNSLFNMAVSEKNVVATIFWLKNNCADYRDRVQIDVQGMQGEVEERLSELQAKLANPLPPSLPPVSTKELIADVLGIRGGGMTATTATTTNPVELPRHQSASLASSSPGSPTSSDHNSL